jgi:hypothetical protein
LISFDILGLGVEAFIESKCYATYPGRDDVCETNVNTKILGAKIPIIPTQKVKCKISKLSKKFQYYRQKIEKEIDTINNLIIFELRKCADQLKIVNDNVKLVTDPSKYDKFIEIR